MLELLLNLIGMHLKFHSSLPSVLSSVLCVFQNQLKDREVKENEGQLQRRINNLEAENRRLKAQLSELKKKLPVSFD